MKKILICAVLGLLVAPSLSAATPKGKKGTRTKAQTTRTAAAKVEKIPVYVSPLDNGYFYTSKVTMPKNAVYYNYISPYWDNPVTYLLDSEGNRLLEVDGVPTAVSTDGIVTVGNYEKGNYLVRLDGTIVMPPVKNQEIRYLGEGLYAFNRDYDRGNSTVIDAKGNVVIPKGSYDFWGTNFINGNIIFCTNTNDDFYYGVMDKTGKILIEPIYDYIVPESEGYMAAVKNDKTGLIDLNGNIIIPFKYDYNYIDSDDDPLPIHVKNGVVNMELNGKWGVIDLNGNTVMEFKYPYLYMNDMGIYVSRESYNHFNLYDFSGRFVKSNAEPTWSLADGLYRYYVNDKCGAIDSQGNVVIQPVFEWISEFKGPTTLAKQNGVYHIIDRTGKIIKHNVGKTSTPETAA